MPRPDVSSKMPEWETLSVERDGPVTWVWLDRPKQRNALNQVLLEEIEQVFRWVQTEYETRVVVLGGRGRSFCAGADVKQPPGLERMAAPSGVTPRERRWLANLGTRALEAIERLDALTIARVHGHAIGGGLLLALACDLRIVADDTVFAIPELDLGDTLNWRGVPRLIAEVGIVRARELVYLSDRFDAARAERYGLVNLVAPSDQIDGAVREWAKRLADKPEGVLQLTKSQFRAYTATLSLGDASEFESNLQLEVLRDAAMREQFGLE